MVNEKYYKGYEGEPQIIFEYREKNSLVFWEGYIYSLMGDMFDQGLKILADFYSCDDNDRWEIENLSDAITQFDLFDLNKIEQEELTSISKFLPEITKEIVKFLNKAIQANQKVYISKD